MPHWGGGGRKRPYSSFLWKKRKGEGISLRHYLKRGRLRFHLPVQGKGGGSFTCWGNEERKTHTSADREDDGVCVKWGGKCSLNSSSGEEGGKSAVLGGFWIIGGDRRAAPISERKKREKEEGAKGRIVFPDSGRGEREVLIQKRRRLSR